MSKPYFSLLMPNYNKAKYIEEAIESVLKQSFKDWELIIVDDKSSDDSVKIIKKYLHDDRIKFFQNKENLGTSKTLQKIIDLSQADILAQIDSDDALTPDCLQELFDFYKKHPKAKVVYTQCMYCNEALQPLHVGHSDYIREGETMLKDSKIVQMRSMQRDLFKEVMSYQVDIDRATDLNFLLKMEEKTKLYFLDKVLYLHRRVPGSLSQGFFKHKSAAAMVKYWAYQRRLNTDIPNFNKAEVLEVLFWGVFASILAKQWGRVSFFAKEIIKTDVFFIFNIFLYILVFKKIIKIYKFSKR